APARSDPAPLLGRARLPQHRDAPGPPPRVDQEASAARPGRAGGMFASPLRDATGAGIVSSRHHDRDDDAPGAGEAPLDALGRPFHGRTFAGAGATGRPVDSPGAPRPGNRE